METKLKTLDIKLARIIADPSCGDFILADAKDADMAFGIAAPGQSPEHHAHEARFRSLDQFRALIRENVRHEQIDIMLMSASTNEILTIGERLFEGSPVTPAARANDTTDIHLVTGGTYASQPSHPFRTATIDHIMCGKVECAPGEGVIGADLGLYSVTFNNHTDLDLVSLNAYRAFRLEAESKGFRHFLEVFDPNACGDQCPLPEDLGRFINDAIVRALAGVVGKGRPLFLKIVYHGPAAMEQLAAYDRNIVPGILGGSSGTTFDAFFQLWEAKKYGARAALYGRMINNSEHQVAFIRHLRLLADGELDDPAEAVRSYHAALEKVGVRPYRSLSDDLVATKRISSYTTKSSSVRIDGGARTPKTAVATARRTKDKPDFDRMSAQEKVAWNLKRWNRAIG